MLKSLPIDLQNYVQDFMPYRQDYNQVVRHFKKVVINCYWDRLAMDLCKEFIFDYKDFLSLNPYVKNLEKTFNNYDYNEEFFQYNWNQVLSNYSYVH